MEALISEQLRSLKAAYINKYGQVIFDVGFNLFPKKLVLKGAVLLPQQAAAALQKTKNVFPGKIINKISILSLNGRHNILGFGKIKEKYRNIPINLLRVPIEIDNLIPVEQNKFRSTQIIYGDPHSKILWGLKDWYLVKLLDETIGWVKKKYLAHELKPTKTKRIHYCTISKRTKFNAAKIITKISLEKFQKICKNYLDIPYLLGGTTKLGIDCSGLTQRIYRDAFSIIIPKKSTDQFKVFKNLPLSPKNYRLGAVLFMEGKNKLQRSHVGLFFDPTKQLIIHSSLTNNKKVQIESIDQLKENYKLLSIGILE